MKKSGFRAFPGRLSHHFREKHVEPLGHRLPFSGEKQAAQVELDKALPYLHEAESACNSITKKDLALGCPWLMILVVKDCCSRSCDDKAET